MIISSLDELRLFSPSNAIDNIESILGFINSSEHDFLKEKLGNELYRALVTYYHKSIRGLIDDYVSQMVLAVDIPPYAQLLYLSQKAVVFDALARAINVQAISVNGAGVNVSTADDYKAADPQAIADYKKACVKEAHSAVNEILQTLEDWAIALPKAECEDDFVEEKEIVDLWKNSRYYYLACSLIIPSASVLQEYYNIYDSREKFIQMLPDLRYIQEDILAPIYGDDFIAFFAELPFAQRETLPSKHLNQILHYLRKIMARYLETRQLKPADARQEVVRNEAIKLTARLNEYIQVHQRSFDDDLLEILKSTSLYINADEADSKHEPRFKNNADGSAMFVTPGLM